MFSDNYVSCVLISILPSGRGLEYAESIKYKEIKPPSSKRGFRGYDTKLYLMVRLQFLSSKECEEPLYVKHSKVHSEPE